MTANEIRHRFLEFFKKRGHAIIRSASLITSDEKGLINQTLFNTAGIQPLIPYLLGQTHPAGKRLANAQKCLRTVDIDDVGDKTHATFFEMLGNWSLGDYFKEDAIKWSYEFLTSNEYGLGLDPARLYVSVFEGDENAPRDDESAEVWKSVGIPEKRIYFKGADSNWWPAVKGKDAWTGPTGPCSEMFYDASEKSLGDIDLSGFIEADQEQKIVEVWNDVFMEYEKNNGKIVGKLKQKNVDTGAGLERLSMIVEGVDDIYETDLLKPLMEKIKKLSSEWDLKSARIVADHVRASVFLIAEGVRPSNTDRGYVLRKILRRSVGRADTLDFGKHNGLDSVAEVVMKIYEESYPDILEKRNVILEEILREENRFRKTLEQGLKEFEKGVDAFTLFSSYGFPLELTLELAEEKGIKVDTDDFARKFKEHQDLSRVGAENKFKGGLADAKDEMVVRYHTATHLLHQALRDVLGESVAQKGSNITRERLRFDFAHETKMTDEEKKRVEEIVNEKIDEALPVASVILPKEQAEKTDAKRFFAEKYGDQVSIYFIGKDLQSAYSKEFCGGPHVVNTRELAGPENKWRFKIIKEEAVARGIRRIKAVLE